MLFFTSGVKITVTVLPHLLRISTMSDLTQNEGLFQVHCSAMHYSTVVRRRNWRCRFLSPASKESVNRQSLI